jgi:hypothetical protein
MFHDKGQLVVIDDMTAPTGYEELPVALTLVLVPGSIPFPFRCFLQSFEPGEPPFPGGHALSCVLD